MTEYALIGSYEADDRPNAEIIAYGSLENLQKIRAMIDEFNGIEAENDDKREELAEKLESEYSVSIKDELGNYFGIDIHRIVELKTVEDY